MLTLTEQFVIGAAIGCFIIQAAYILTDWYCLKREAREAEHEKLTRRKP